MQRYRNRRSIGFNDTFTMAGNAKPAKSGSNISDRRQFTWMVNDYCKLEDLKVAVFQFAGIASSSIDAVETAESHDYSILVFRDYRLEIQATTAGGDGKLKNGDSQNPTMYIYINESKYFCMNKRVNKFHFIG
jgi:hypothetical protein